MVRRVGDRPITLGTGQRDLHHLGVRQGPTLRRQRRDSRFLPARTQHLTGARSLALGASTPCSRSAGPHHFPQRNDADKRVVADHPRVSKALGIAIPRSLLLRADGKIE